MGIAVIDEFAVTDSATLPFFVVRIKGGPRVHICLSLQREIVRSHFFKKFESALLSALKNSQLGRTDALRA